MRRLLGVQHWKTLMSCASRDHRTTKGYDQSRHRTAGARRAPPEDTEKLFIKRREWRTCACVACSAASCRAVRSSAVTSLVTACAAVSFSRNERVAVSSFCSRCAVPSNLACVHVTGSVVTLLKPSHCSDVTLPGLRAPHRLGRHTAGRQMSHCSHDTLPAGRFHTALLCRSLACVHLAGSDVTLLQLQMSCCQGSVALGSFGLTCSVEARER